MRESKIENEVCKYARSKGWLALKWSSPGEKGVPDRIFLKDYGEIFFIEFKATGKQPTRLQVVFGLKLIGMGFSVYFVDSIEQGKKLIDEWSDK